MKQRAWRRNEKVKHEPQYMNDRSPLRSDLAAPACAVCRFALGAVLQRTDAGALGFPIFLLVSADLGADHGRIDLAGVPECAP